MATLAQRSLSLAAAVTLLGLTASCSKNSPTTPTATLVTEDKSGTLVIGGTDTKTFTVNYTYDYTPASVTLKSVTSTATGAPLSITLGLSFGSVNSFDQSCTRSSQATQNAAAIGVENATGSIFSVGPFCMQAFDAGTLTEPVNYTVTIKHY
jgi:hypothetical protein